MTETRTLEFESARALQSLFANDIKLLKNLEDSLGVRVTTREGWVKMEGEPEKLDRAQRVFDQLEEARKRDVDIQKHEFNYAVNSVSEERADNLIHVFEYRHRVYALLPADRRRAGRDLVSPAHLPFLPILRASSLARRGNLLGFSEA